jgi:hypothetical protein
MDNLTTGQMIGIGVGGVALAGIGAGIIYKKKMDREAAEQERFAAEKANQEKKRIAEEDLKKQMRLDEEATEKRISNVIEARQKHVLSGLNLRQKSHLTNKKQQQASKIQQGRQQPNIDDAKAKQAAAKAQQAAAKAQQAAAKESYNFMTSMITKNITDLILKFTGKFIIGKKSHDNESYRKVTSADFNDDSFKQQFVDECKDGILLFENITDSNSSQMINYPLLLDNDVGLMYEKPNHRIYVSSIDDNNRCILSYTTNKPQERNPIKYQHVKIIKTDDLKKITPTNLDPNLRGFILDRIPDYVTKNRRMMIPIIGSTENYPYLYVRIDFQGGKKTRRRRSQKKR